MRFRATVIAATGWVLLFASHGAVWAQQGDEVAQQGDEVEADGEVAPAQGSSDERTFEQMIDEAQALQERIVEQARTISHMLRAARQAEDVVRRLCLDDKLNQIDIASQNATDSLEAMKAAAKVGEDIQARRDYFVVRSLAETAEAVAEEANQCIGGGAEPIKGASLNVTMDPEIPSGETTKMDSITPRTSVPNTAAIQDPPMSASPVL